jgi:hypothetical protein
MTHRVTLFVGDVCEGLGQQALQFDPDAFLIDHSNYKNFLVSPTNNNITVYTSLGDLPKNLEIFYHIAMTATEIIYAPPAEWTDGLTVDPSDPTSCVQGLTEIMLLLISNRRPVQNLNLCYFNPMVNPLVDQRQTAVAQLWVAGCSITHGVGVNSSQRYGHLLSQQLNLPCSFLTRQGSSIAWAADQILRSDILPGDIVVWGITSTERTTLFEHGKMNSVNIGSYTRDPGLEKSLPAKTLFNQTTFYSHLYAIEQVINYCKKQQATLLLLGLLVSDNMLRYLKAKDNYFHYDYDLEFKDHTKYIKFIDLGTDNQHPGAQQHQLYADYCQNILKNPISFN